MPDVTNASRVRPALHPGLSTTVSQEINTAGEREADNSFSINVNFKNVQSIISMSKRLAANPAKNLSLS
jgi:hypothetical protein